VARSYISVPEVDIDWLHISGYALFHPESSKVVQELTTKAKAVEPFFLWMPLPTNHSNSI